MKAYFDKTIHRLLLEKKLRASAHLLTGNILDIGSKNRRYDKLFQGIVTAVDRNPNPSMNVLYGDIEKGLNFPNESFEGILCLEVFEYLESKEKPVEEIHRLLTLNGRAIVSVPFLNHDHKDKQRYTRTWLTTILEKHFEVEVRTLGNGYTVVWDILRRKASRHSRPLRYLAYIALLPYLLIIKILRLERNSDDTYSGVFLILQKRRV